MRSIPWLPATSTVVALAVLLPALGVPTSGVSALLGASEIVATASGPEAAGGIAGTVTGSDGRVIDATVSISSIDPVTGNTLETRVTDTDAGAYSFRALPDGYWTVAFTPDDQRYAEEQWFDLSAYYAPDALELRGTALDGIDAELPLAGSISGAVTGGFLGADRFVSGSVGVEVQVLDAEAATWVSTGDQRSIESDGSFVVAGLHPDSYRISVVDVASGTIYGTSGVLEVLEGRSSSVALLVDPRPLPGGAPFGALDSISVLGASISFRGWAIDPDTAAPIDVVLREALSGFTPRPFPNGLDRASDLRPDVGSAYPFYGPHHGFSDTLVLPVNGQRTVCAYAFNVGAGPAYTVLGCRVVTLRTGSPYGSLDSVSGAVESISLRGWAIDPDTSASIDIHVYVDGRGVVVPADQTRGDVAAAAPGYGAAHGFDTKVEGMTPGRHRVCVYAIDSQGFSPNTELACRTVDVASRAPRGSVDAVTSGLGVVTVSGWALDPDTTASIDVHVYVDGVGRIGTASGPRDDVAAAFPGSGRDHGFSISVSGLDGGPHRMCAYAINVGPPAANTLLQCRTVIVPTGAPFGTLDPPLIVGSDVVVRGWAIDPDTAGAVETHVYVDGRGRIVQADRPRPDVAAAYAGYGPGHGFSLEIGRLDPGEHRVCAYGIDSGPSTGASLLLCQTVLIAG